MPNALFFNVPAHGHINPSLPLVAELARRGHGLTYFATEKFHASIAAAGAAFRAYAAVQDDYFDARGLHGGVPQRVAGELFNTTGQILPELLQTARDLQPDYILFDGMCPWGYFVAQILRLPAVASLSLPPLTSPPLRALWNRDVLRALVPMVTRDFGKGVAANKRSHALGKQYGVPPLGPTSLLNALGDLSISYTSSYFQAYAHTVSESVRFVGWTVSEATADNAFPFAHTSRRLVYISLGTLNNDDVGFFRACIQAFAGGNDDTAVVISTGNRIRPEVFGALPSSISVQGWVPQISVLRRAALFVTHGGMNSVHDGLYCGVPLLLVPQQGEQLMTALRVAELGAGLVLNPSAVNAEALRASAQRLLTEPGFKAEANRIGESLRAAGGAARAADEIEAVLQQRLPNGNR